MNAYKGGFWTQILTTKLGIQKRSIWSETFNGPDYYLHSLLKPKIMETTLNKMLRSYNLISWEFIPGKKFQRQQNSYNKTSIKQVKSSEKNSLFAKITPQEILSPIEL